MQEDLSTASSGRRAGLSVVLPAFEEIDAVEPLLKEIEDALAATAGDWEVVVVDDGSQDGTPERLEQLAVQWRWLRVIRHQRNRGQSAAVCTGVSAARFEWVATLDADGQNPPSEIPRMLAFRDEHGAGSLLVAGVREKRNDSRFRLFQTRVANGVRARILGDGCPDSGCGLKLFRRQDFLRLPRFDHMHRFLPALFLRLGARMVYLPVRHRSRDTGRSKYGMTNRLWVGITDMIGVAWLLRRPLDLESDVRLDDVRREDLALDRVWRTRPVRTAPRGPVDRQ